VRGGCIVDPRGGGDLDDQVGLAGVEPLLEEVLGSGRGGVRVSEPARGQVVRGGAAEDASEDEQEPGERQDPAWSLDAEIGESSEHGVSQ